MDDEISGNKYDTDTDARMPAFEPAKLSLVVGNVDESSESGTQCRESNQHRNGMVYTGNHEKLCQVATKLNIFNQTYR